MSLTHPDLMPWPASAAPADTPLCCRPDLTEASFVHLGLLAALAVLILLVWLEPDPVLATGGSPPAVAAHHFSML